MAVRSPRGISMCHYGILVTLGGYLLDVERRAQRHEEALSLIGVLNFLTVLCC